MSAKATADTALVFPGQGSQTSDMGEVVAAERPDLLESLVRQLGCDPFAGGVESSTAIAQPAIFCASLAYWQRAGRPLGGMVAGHSLGELTALVAGDALDAEAGLWLSIERGALMEEAAAKVPGGMLAVLGAAAEHPDSVAGRFGLSIANENAPGQVVFSGPAEAIEQARRVLRVEGQKTIRLQVAGAFHSPAMATAERRFQALLRQVAFDRPRVPVYSSVLAAPFVDPRSSLAGALTRPVRWRLTLERMRAAGAERFLEPGPGDVLTGLVRRCLPEAEAHALAEPDAARV